MSYDHSSVIPSRVCILVSQCVHMYIYIAQTEIFVNPICGFNKYLLQGLLKETGVLGEADISTKITLHTELQKQ